MNNNIREELRSLTRKLKSVKAKDIMTKKVITTTEGKNLSDIAKLMTKNRISGLPVLRKKNKLVGLITATDLFVVMDMIKAGDVVSSDMQAISNPTVKFAMSTQTVKIKKNTGIIILKKDFIPTNFSYATITGNLNHARINNTCIKSNNIVFFHKSIQRV